MVCSCLQRRLLRFVVLAAVLFLPSLVAAEERVARPEAQTVELFSGIDEGLITVQLIPRNASQCRLLVANQTDRPLSVRLPEAFAGVPVLAQFPDFGVDDAPQQVGVGLPFQPFGPGPMNVANPNPGGPNFPPGPLFSIPPEKVGKLKLDTVCLEHGKPDPRPKFPYRVQPIESVTSKPGVAELCAMLGRKEVSQQAAQLAAWHLNNDLSWEELAKIRRKTAFGSRPQYSRQELEAGKKAVEKARKRARQADRSEQSRSLRGS
jgi:hypothetical protein